MKQHRVGLAAALGISVAAAALAVDGSLDTSPAPWRFVGLPYQSKPMTRFRIIAREGARVLKVRADESYGDADNTHGHSLALLSDMVLQ